MEKFITSKWIPVSLFGTLILSFILLHLIGGLTEAAIEILLLVVYLTVMFLYFPVLTIFVIRKNHPKKQNIVNNVGLFSLLITVAGLASKMYHLPGSAFHLVAGYFILLTTYIPAWFVLKNKETGGRLRLFYFLLANFFACCCIYGWFNTMHYPWSGATFYILLFATVLLVPYLLYLSLKKQIQFRFKDHFVFVFLIAYIFGSRQMAFMRDVRNSNISTNQEQAEKNFNLNARKAQFLHDAFNSVNSSDSLFLLNKKKLKTIKAVSDSLQKYIADLKSLIVSETADIPKSIADTISFYNIDPKAKANYDIPSVRLFDTLSGSRENSSYNAYELRRKLSEFSDTLLFFSPEDFRTQFKQYNPVQIVDQNVYEDGIQFTWEISLFLHRPLGTVYTQLTNIQADAKGEEVMLVTELFNKANQNRKENLAAQLTDLSLKYENEKKEKQISLLEKDKQLNDARLTAKDLEISKTRETLIYFVFALVLFVVLIVFIVRSNVQRRKANQILNAQKTEIEEQKHLLEEKQKEILDSITYAKRLQQAILPPQAFIDKYVPHNFVLYNPKDIVAGDFFWAETVNDLFFIAAADSTGHGVPGAIVSVVCSNALNRSIKEFRLTDTGKILDKTRELVIATFEKSNDNVKDGMDISLLCIDKPGRRIFWSGANNPLWYIEADELKEIKADKQPIGKTDNPVPFKTHQINYKDDSVFYLFTDGLADQFGGPNGKKFKYKQFEEVLLSIHRKPMQEQLNFINQKFEDWKGSLEQVDDVCVIGIKI